MLFAECEGGTSINAVSKLCSGQNFFSFFSYLGLNQLPFSTLCGVSSLVMRVCGLNANGKRIHIYVCLSAKREMPTSPKWALTCCLPAVRQSGERPAKRHHNEQDGSTDLQQQNSIVKFRVRDVLWVKQLLRLGVRYTKPHNFVSNPWRHLRANGYGLVRPHDLIFVLT